MRTISLTVNGMPITETVAARMHLADFLRDRLSLTATHLRCEQGVCGACTLLIDGQPARSCITYAALCEGSEVTTLEGLEHDPVMVALREAFSAEHALQCGFCTPGMLVTARDVVLRLPHADETRVRRELSGNLCRCTGYTGIVRAIRRVLEAGAPVHQVPPRASLGPVGAHPAAGGATPARPLQEAGTPALPAAAAAEVGLGSAAPNITLRQSFSVAAPPDRVWRTLGDVARIVACMPGAALTGPVVGNRITGRMRVTLGPVAATFTGEGRMDRDEAARHGTIAGGGRDAFTRSRLAAEVAYRVAPCTDGAGSVVDVEVRALLTGPLAQFSRGGIIADVAARLTDMFAANLERTMAAEEGEPAVAQSALRGGALIGSVLLARLRQAVARLLGPRGQR
jgi:aerobic carbon-monoxide dehydrogenase small subunit